MKRILITGANGFIGRFVAYRLLGWPVELHHLDIHPWNCQKSGYFFHQFNLLSSGAYAKNLENLLKTIDPDICLHLAWYTNPRDYLNARINIEWRDASFEFAKTFARCGGKRFIAVGTCLEYGQVLTEFCDEEATPRLPETLYAQCKTELYDKLTEFFKKEQTEFAWPRIFFVYGPHDRPQRLIGKVIDALSRGVFFEPKNGGARRDYIYTNDLAEQLCAILFSDLEGAINCGSGHTVSIYEICRLIGEIMGKSNLIVENHQVTDYPVIQPSLKRLISIIPNFSVTPLDLGLKKSVDWFLYQGQDLVNER